MNKLLDWITETIPRIVCTMLSLAVLGAGVVVALVDWLVPMPK